jgi:hypothetical protein
MRGNITRRARLAVLEYQRTRDGRDSSCRGLEFRCPIKVCVFDGASSCRSSASVGSRPSRISRPAATAAIAILGKHFVWSTFQLDSDPLAWKTACAGQSEPCVAWDPSTIDSSAGPTPLAKVFVVFALPAFRLSLLVVGFAGSHGANQIILFFALTPPLIAAWFYFLGRVVDRIYRRHKKQ